MMTSWEGGLIGIEKGTTVDCDQWIKRKIDIFYNY
jgi:hypothetical protein